MPEMTGIEPFLPMQNASIPHRGVPLKHHAKLAESRRSRKECEVTLVEIMSRAMKTWMHSAAGRDRSGDR